MLSLKTVSGRWERKSPLLAFFAFITGGLDLFLRIKLELQVLSLSDYRAGGGMGVNLPCAMSLFSTVFCGEDCEGEIPEDHSI